MKNLAVIIFRIKIKDPSPEFKGWLFWMTAISLSFLPSFIIFIIIKFFLKEDLDIAIGAWILVFLIFIHSFYKLEKTIKK